MCPKEQQTSDNLIVKDYCFIIEVFDKFSFSGIVPDQIGTLSQVGTKKISKAGPFKNFLSHVGTLYFGFRSQSH